MKTNKILVTGASGFAAEHLIPRLRSAGYYVFGIDRKERPSAKCDEFLSIDLNDIMQIRDNLTEIDAVIHLAAARADWGVTDSEFYADNVEATRELLNALKSQKLDYFVFVSSISVYPQNSTESLTEVTPTGPINVYGKSKLKAEQLCVDYQNEYGCRMAIIRPTVLYGISDPDKTGIYRAADNNVFRLIDGIASGRFAMVGNGNVVKSMAYIENFVDAIIFIAEHCPKFDIYTYADPPALPLRDLVMQISTRLGVRRPVRLPFYLVLWCAKVFDIASAITGVNFPINSNRVKTLTRSTNVDIKSLTQLGFLQSTSTVDAIAKTVDWYLKLKLRNKSFFLFKE